MSITYEITPLPTHIYVRGEGCFEFVDAVQMFSDALSAAGAHRQLRILIDVRKVTGNLTKMQRFEFGKAVAQLYARNPDGGPALIALFGNEPLLDPDRFGEAVAANRGVPVKATTDMNEAMNWLGIETDGRA